MATFFIHALIEKKNNKDNTQDYKEHAVCTIFDHSSSNPAKAWHLDWHASIMSEERDYSDIVSVDVIGAWHVRIRLLDLHSSGVNCNRENYDQSRNKCPGDQLLLSH